jgi:beta-glucanase (GH16 family)
MASGTGVGHALVLWPASNTWPPEVDFSEDNGAPGRRTSTLATVHYGAKDHLILRKLSVDLTRWHTLGVRWLPRSLVFTVDGRDWATVHGKSVPSVPMVLDLQTQTWPCAGAWGHCPNASTPRQVNMNVDWVAAYAPTARTLRSARR